MNAYSHCTVGATYDYSSTTSPTNLSSILDRGRCTLGVVSDIYWKFSEY